MAFPLSFRQQVHRYRENAGARNAQRTKYESLVRVVQLLDTVGAASDKN